MARQRLQWIEIDIPRCSRTWGVGACTASFSDLTPRKCFNTFGTCQVRSAFLAELQTVVLFPNVSGAPIGVLPCLSGDIRETEATVNIAGADPTMAASGRRGTLEWECRDFRDNDVWFDRYQAERVSGAAQTDEAGYDPSQRGTVFGKLKSRWPHFAGRACRIKEGWLENGALTVEATRHYLLTDFETDKPGRASFKAQDVLNLAGNKRALAPKPCRGKLLNAIAADATTATLSPAGIGNLDYAASGRAKIGSEIVSFTRSGDVLTFTGRGLSGTTAQAHEVSATVQQTLRYVNVRADIVIRDLLVNFAAVPSAQIPTAEWADEMDKGAPGLRLTAEITAPEQVDKLVAEMGIFGLSIWADASQQKVGLKTNRPLFDDTTFEITDGGILKDGASVKSRDDRRLTEVLFQSVQIDPVKALADDNFLRYEYTIDGDAKSPDAYGDVRLKVEKIRWINQGNDALARILSLRYLKLFSTAPEHVMVTVKRNQFSALRLTDVVYLTSDVRQDATGKPERKAYRVISKQNVGPGEVELTLQRYFFEGRYGRIQANTATPTYATATASEKATGFYISDNAGFMSDGTRGPQLT